MLLRFKVANFRSFGSEVVLDLTASSDKSLLENTFETPAREDGKPVRLLRSAAVFGANASGKSNLVKAMHAFRRCVVESATSLNEGDPMPDIQPFIFDSELKVGPSKFEVTVQVQSIVWRYGAQIDRARVVSEWLFQRRCIARAPETLTFKRDGQKWTFGPSIDQADRALLEQRTRGNCLALSKAAQEQVAELVPLYRWFRSKVRVIDSASDAVLMVAMALSEVAETETRNGVLVEMARVADLSITDLGGHFEEYEPPELLRSWLTERGQQLPAAFRHPVVTVGRNSSKGNVSGHLPIEEESEGTRRYLAQALVLRDALKNGHVVFWDEMDTSLHPLLVAELVRVMNDDELGFRGAQFVVATHSSQQLTNWQLRRDQIYFVEKKQNLESELYSLWDFREKPRKEEVWERAYLLGRFGGIPIVGDLKSAILRDLEREDAMQSSVLNGASAS
jgi:hypothetical protein